MKIWHNVKIVKKKWNSLSGSTSNPLKHIRTSHYIKLTDEEKDLMSHNGETSGKSGVKRTLRRKIYDEGALPRSHPSVKEVDRKLAKVFISSCASWSLLENDAFGDFCQEMLDGRYNIPSRNYIQENVMTPMYQETKEHIKKELKKHINIGLTTNAWTSTV